jgi:hypothetical protein
LEHWIHGHRVTSQSAFHPKLPYRSLVDEARGFPHIHHLHFDIELPNCVRFQKERADESKKH